jgi:hypothetical protein
MFRLSNYTDDVAQFGPSSFFSQQNPDKNVGISFIVRWTSVVFFLFRQSTQQLQKKNERFF